MSILPRMEIEKAKAFNMVDLQNYRPNSIEHRSILRKNTGHIKAISFDSGQLLTGTISPFDNFIQVIEGKAKITINNKIGVLETGQIIIIPAHSSYSIEATVPLKVMSTIVKSGYEEVSL